MSSPQSQTFRKPTTTEIEWRYAYHAPDATARQKHERVRAAIIACATEIVDQTPCSPEQTRALNALDEAMMLANAAIARNSSAPPATCGECGMLKPCQCDLQSDRSV